MTIISTSSVATKRPWSSFTVKVTISVPFQSCADPNVISKLTISIVTLSLSVTDNVNASSSISEMYPLKSTNNELSSANVKLSGKDMVGGSFTGVTVNTKVSSSVKNPSLTVTVISESPL